MAIAGLALILINSLLLHGTNGESLKSRDPYIVCPGNFVPDNANGLPYGYSPSDYYDVMQLCSALNGNQRNVGCVCTSSQESSFHCYAEIADVNLFRAVVTFSRKQFPAFCADSCFCTNPDVASFDQGRMERARQRQRPALPNRTDSDATYQIHQPGGGAEGGYRAIPNDQGNGWHQELNKDPVPMSTVSHGQCWKNCTSNADCLGDGEKGCMCSTQSERYQPGSGTVAFVAACIISISGGGGKRHDTRPCPCNATYVSYGCCGAVDGLVWEEEHFKLGELTIEHGL